jgi:hypothetical protein
VAQENNVAEGYHSFSVACPTATCRNLQLLALPMWILNPFCPEQILLWSAKLLWGSAVG